MGAFQFSLRLILAASLMLSPWPAPSAVQPLGSGLCGLSKKRKTDQGQERQG